MHHRQKIGGDLIKSLVDRYTASGAVNGAGNSYSEAEMVRLLSIQEGWDYRAGIAFWFPNPHPAKSPARPRVEVQFSLNPASPSRGLFDGTSVHLPLFDREKHRWVWVSAGALDHEDAYEATWFLDKALLSLPVLQPEFACMDTDVLVARNLGDDPRQVAWPLMVFGPEMVQRHGADHLRRAPAWKTEPLAYGGFLVQAAENPFMATRKELRAVADHLGLECP